VCETKKEKKKKQCGPASSVSNHAATQGPPIPGSSTTARAARTEHKPATSSSCFDAW
jgi:hypothetical protein